MFVKTEKYKAHIVRSTFEINDLRGLVMSKIN